MKESTPPQTQQRVGSVLPKYAEFFLCGMISLCVVVGILARWSTGVHTQDMVGSLAPRNEDNSTASVKLRGLYFKDSNEARVFVEDVVRKALQEKNDGQGTQNSSHTKATPLQAPLKLEDLEKEIDLLQAQMLDYLNGEEGLAEDDDMLSGGSLQNLVQPFHVIETFRKIHAYAKLVKSLDYNRTDFLQLGRRARANLISYTLLYEKPSMIPILSSTVASPALEPTLKPTINDLNFLYKDLHSIVKEISRKLYPWLAPTHLSVREMQLRYLSTSTDGIVLCSGKWHFEMAVHAITTLRKVLNCTLPIEIHYGGKDDLEPNMIQAFNSMENVRTVNILDYFPVETKLWGGWSMKPFAMLASSFRRVIFVDADALFFQDPRVLLHESAIVKRFGQMFYYDRTLGGNDPWWFKSINPQFSKYSSTLRYMQKDKPRSSQHEMESGVVVVDKGRTGVLHAMLLVCKMNSKVERDGITYHRVYGDKETYWISWDLIRVPYRFTPSYGGTIGYRNSKGNICGGLFHTDERLRPLWWNGGVMANKHISKDAEFMKFEFAAFDSYGEGIVWEWETKTTPFCLGPRDPDHEVLELTAAQKEMGSRFVDLYKEIRLGSGGWEEYFRKTYKVEF